MNRFNVDEFEIELWRNAFNRSLEETQRLKKIVDDDPITVILDCNAQLKELLDTYKGKERLTPEFNAKIQKLARKEKRAKHLAKNFKLSDAMDDHHNAKWKSDQILMKYNNLKFYYGLKNKSKPEQDKAIVEKIVDEVSK